MFVFQKQINNKNALIIQNGDGSIPRVGAEVVAVYVNDDSSFTYIAGTWDGQTIIPGEQPSSLPEVTPSDEGKVLTVDSAGEWVAGEAEKGVKFEVVAELPATGDKSIIYLVSEQTAEGDVYAEYVCVDDTTTPSTYEKLGTTNQVDISGKQDTLVSGQNIKTINNNSILGSGNLDISSLPSVTSADAGKVLIVDSQGKWTVGNPPSDLDQLMQEEF